MCVFNAILTWISDDCFYKPFIFLLDEQRRFKVTYIPLYTFFGKKEDAILLWKLMDIIKKYLHSLRE